MCLTAGWEGPPTAPLPPCCVLGCIASILPSIRKGLVAELPGARCHVGYFSIHFS